MVKLLIKKQFMELFKGYFYDAKKNKKRSKAGTILWFGFFALIMFGVLGGMFAAISVSICKALCDVGFAWLYFLIVSIMAILFGTFGSVFNTYASLYLGKDNDLLLSMPIEVKDVVTARLLNVYLLGALYSLVVILPASIVYWVTVPVSAGIIISDVALLLIITVFVMILSCLLGYVVAKISVKLKNKSFVVVLASLAFLALYYLFYFKAEELLSQLIENVVIYGEKIKGAAYGLYLFGRIGEGDIIATLIFTGIIIVLSVLTWLLLSKSFLKIATSSGNLKTKNKKVKTTKKKSIISTLLSKEFTKFLSSANYMLNRGLGLIFIPAAGIFVLIKGDEFLEVLKAVFATNEGAVLIIGATALTMIMTMCDTVSASVSLEGKNIWILQSLPVEPKTILRAKALMNLLIVGMPVFFSTICLLIKAKAKLVFSLLIFVFIMVYILFYVSVCSFVGIKTANLSWTNEIVPIKQSIGALITIFGGWIISIAFAALYLLAAYKIGFIAYILICIVLMSGITILLNRWLDTKGAKLFAEL